MKVVISRAVGGLSFNSRDYEEWEILTGDRLFFYSAVICGDLGISYRLVGVDEITLSDEIHLRVMRRDIGTSVSYDDFFKYLSDMLDIDGLSRSSPNLISIAEKRISREKESKWKIIEVPDDLQYSICSGDDGAEWIAEDHRTWC